MLTSRGCGKQSIFIFSIRHLLFIIVLEFHRAFQLPLLSLSNFDLGHWRLVPRLPIVRGSRTDGNPSAFHATQYQVSQRSPIANMTVPLDFQILFLCHRCVQSKDLWLRLSYYWDPSDDSGGQISLTLQHQVKEYRQLKSNKCLKSTSEKITESSKCQ
jgi:hypothetical protein